MVFLIQRRTHSESLKTVTVVRIFEITGLVSFLGKIRVLLKVSFWNLPLREIYVKLKNEGFTFLFLLYYLLVLFETRVVTGTVLSVPD